MWLFGPTKSVDAIKPYPEHLVSRTRGLRAIIQVQKPAEESSDKFQSVERRETFVRYKLQLRQLKTETLPPQLE